MGHCLRRRCAAILLSMIAGTAAGQEPASVGVQDRKPVPIMAYSPGGGCRGIAIISPGAGGSETGYAYLGRTLSALGFLAVVVGHQESGRRALREHVRGNSLREGLAKLITDPEAYRSRFAEIAAARRWAQPRCNASESVLIGHSMGAATTMIEAGARNLLGVSGADAFNVYIALSPQGAGSIFPPDAWSGIAKPVLSLTGTRDGELGGGPWETRTEPYGNMPAGCKWLGVIDGAAHLNFAGNGLSGKVEALTSQAIGAFLEGVHRGDCRVPGSTPGMALQGK
ncbi:MAG: alpha/beta hydrolase [Betaproteobacteria bacterium]